MSLLPVVEALEASRISTVMRQDPYFSAVVNVIHLLGLVIFAGSILIVDLRLLGGGIKKQPLAQVARDAQPWLIGSLILMLSTGIPQILLTPTKQYYSQWFWLKMEILPIAIIYNLGDANGTGFFNPFASTAYTTKNSSGQSVTLPGFVANGQT